MTYTVRYAHLDKFSDLNIGDTVSRGTRLGMMGNTGTQLIHLHIDCVEGAIRDPWTLQSSELGLRKSAHRQLNYFIDHELFDFEVVVATPYNCQDYMVKTGKVHLAYDVVPEDRNRTRDHYWIFWNRTPQGMLISRYETEGYGKAEHYQFEA
jgi:hypothetical protein